MRIFSDWEQQKTIFTSSVDLALESQVEDSGVAILPRENCNIDCHGHSVGQRSSVLEDNISHLKVSGGRSPADA